MKQFKISNFELTIFIYNFIFNLKYFTQYNMINLNYFINKI